MFKSKFFLLFILAFIIFLFGCSKDSNTGKNDIQDNIRSKKMVCTLYPDGMAKVKLNYIEMPFFPYDNLKKQFKKGLPINAVEGQCAYYVGSNTDVLQFEFKYVDIDYNYIIISGEQKNFKKWVTDILFL